jgi:hypothetical protein
MAFARAAFAAAPAGDVRCLVVHHHFVPVPGGEGGPPLPGAARRLREIEQMGADLVLGGHVHRLHLTTSRDLIDGEGPGVPLVACGTTTSRRGRPPEVGANSLNVVRVGAEEIEVTPYLRAAAALDFPHARVLIHQPLITGRMIGPAVDINIQAREMEKLREELNGILAESSGQSLEKITRDTDRDFYLNAKEAIEYGLADKIVEKI